MSKTKKALKKISKVKAGSTNVPIGIGYHLLAATTIPLGIDTVPIHMYH